MAISLEGIGATCATFNTSGTITAGQAVTMSSNQTVVKAGDSSKFCGVAVNVDNDIAAVQLTGYTKLTYNGATPPSIGYCSLAGNGLGGVKVDTVNGRSVLVVEIDSIAKTVGIIL